MAIISASNDREWQQALSKMPISDYYFAPEYHKAFETDSKRTAHSFFFEKGGDKFFYPFMMGKIEQVAGSKIDFEANDIETVYGYTGPLSTTNNADFINSAYANFHDFCKQNNIVSELVRFNPILRNHEIKPQGMNVFQNRLTVSIELQGEDKLWEGYHPKLRNEIRKAEKTGLRFEIQKFSAQEFAKLYADTMQRISAESFYLFSDEHFKLYENNPNTQIFSVSKDGVVIAAAILMFHDKLMHYHLSCSTREDNQSLGTKFVIHNAALYGIQNGYKQIHLGGGRTVSPDDSLLFFKKRFGSKINEFFIGTNVLDHEKYTKLCDIWRQANPDRQVGKFLQLYRL